MHINSWVAMQLLLGNHTYETAGLPCSCHQSIMHINSWVAMQLSPEHHAYKQLGCHAAVTRALYRDISSLVGLELAFGHGSSDNHNSLVSGVIKQLHNMDFLFFIYLFFFCPAMFPGWVKNGVGSLSVTQH